MTKLYLKMTHPLKVIHYYFSVFSMFKIIAWITFAATVISHKQCAKNANLWKSIQYQLKLVESSEGRCDCGSQGLSK